MQKCLFIKKWIDGPENPWSAGYQLACTAYTSIISSILFHTKPVLRHWFSQEGSQIQYHQKHTVAIPYMCPLQEMLRFCSYL